jgi:hypothetical protein
MSDPIPQGRLRSIISDGEPIVQLQCPGCGVWGEVDDDQLRGRVSTEHSIGPDDTHPNEPSRSGGCGFHEARDWASTAEWIAEGPQPEATR